MSLYMRQSAAGKNMTKRSKFQRVSEETSSGNAARIEPNGPAKRRKKPPPLNPDDVNGMPARMVYSPSGIIPATVCSPDHEPPVMVTVTTRLDRGSRSASRTTNGLTARADAMARWVAHGSSLADAFRAAYNVAPDAKPLMVSQRANAVAKAAGWQASVTEYANELARKRAQSAISMADYVKSRLVLESQTAGQDGARIQSLKLLGMTEGLFTQVTRHERVIDAKDLESLKAKLEQRVKDVLARVSGPMLGPRHGTQIPQMPVPDTHRAGEPLERAWDPLHEKNAKVQTQSPPISGPSVPAEGPVHPAEGGVPPLDVGELDEFSGPLVLNGGLKQD